MADYYWAFNAIAKDFQPISEVADQIVKSDVSKTSAWLEKLDDSIKKKIVERAIIDILQDAQSENSGVEIGCSSVRKRERIKLFSEFAGRKAIGGIVGAISGRTTIKADIVGGSKDDLYAVNINLQIRSRMDAGDSFYFVTTLLNHGNMIVNSYTVISSQDEMFDFLLIDILRSRILEAIPKGHYRTYQRFERNDDKLKGTIDMARHICENAGRDNGKIAYSFRENTIDNYFNKLLVTTYRYIKEKYPELTEEKLDSDNLIKNYINILIYQVDCSETDISHHVINNLRPITHPFYSEYEEVRKVCLKILRDEGISVFNLGDDSTNGFLYYLPDLWEDFLKDEMKLILGDRFTVRDQVSKKFFESRSSDGKRYSKRSSRPDFLFNKLDNKNPCLILDAKFKPGWKKAIDGTALGNYLSEDINKCIRDMVVYDALGTGIIFPYSASDILDIKEDISSEDITDDSVFDEGLLERKTILSDRDLNVRSLGESGKSFYVLPIYIPETEMNQNYISYQAWKEALDCNLKTFGKKLLLVLNECVDLQRGYI